MQITDEEWKSAALVFQLPTNETLDDAPFQKVLDENTNVEGVMRAFWTLEDAVYTIIEVLTSDVTFSWIKVGARILSPEEILAAYRDRERKRAGGLPK